LQAQFDRHQDLLVQQIIQEQRIERLAAALSFGYVRGRMA
jgi:hypothetical protein